MPKFLPSPHLIHLSKFTFSPPHKTERPPFHSKTKNNKSTFHRLRQPSSHSENIRLILDTGNRNEEPKCANPAVEEAQ